MAYQLPTKNWFSGFSLRKVFIAPGAGSRTSGTSASTWTRLPGIMTMNATPGGKSVDQYGDDGLVNIWIYDARMAIELDTSMTVADIITLLNGTTPQQNSGVVTVYYGTDLEYQPPHVFIRGEAAARLEGPGTPTSASKYVRYTVFNAQLTNIVTPENMSYGRVHDQKYRVEALPAYYDENGTTLAGVGGAGATFAVAKAEFGIAALDLES